MITAWARVKAEHVGADGRPWVPWHKDEFGEHDFGNGTWGRAVPTPEHMADTVQVWQIKLELFPYMLMVVEGTTLPAVVIGRSYTECIATMPWLEAVAFCEATVQLL